MEAQAKANETGETQSVYDKEQKMFVKINPISVRVKVGIKPVSYYYYFFKCILVLLKINEMLSYLCLTFCLIYYDYNCYLLKDAILDTDDERPLSQSILTHSSRRSVVQEEEKKAGPSVVIKTGKVVADFEEVNLVIDTESEEEFLPPTQLPNETQEKWAN